MQISTKEAPILSLKNSALTYAQRAVLCHNPSARHLFEIIERKQSNLGVAADVTTVHELYALIEAIGHAICILKTHIDILDDFDDTVPARLRAYAKQYDFLLFEDRKFADIGNTVTLQYEKGIYRIVEWADIVNAHIIPGPGIIEGLQKIGLSRGRGLLLVAQMSSAGSLAHGEYTQTCIAYAQHYPQFVIGFICQEKLVDDPRFIHMTPGVQLQEGTDKLGQQYNTPETAILHRVSDVILVGRGIYQADDPAAKAEEYRLAGWQAYQKRLQG